MFVLIRVVESSLKILGRLLLYEEDTSFGRHPTNVCSLNYTMGCEVLQHILNYPNILQISIKL